MKRLPHSSHGFTLLEVIIAIMVLSIGLLGLANLQSVGVRVGHDSELRTRAAMLAYEALDLLRANLDRQDDLADYALTLGSESSSRNSLDNWLNRPLSGVRTGLPGGAAGIAINGETATVTVQWLERGIPGATDAPEEGLSIERFAVSSRIVGNLRQ